MKKIKVLIVLLFPIFFFLLVIGLAVGTSSKMKESGNGATCEYITGLTENAKIEEKRNYVKSRVSNEKLVNAVLGIYAKEEYQEILTIIDKMNALYVYVTEKEKNITVTSLIQAYKYDEKYLDFLIEKDENVSIRINKEYQEKIGSTSDEDYRYYISVLSILNPKCSTSTDGLPLNKPYTITGYFPNYNQDGTGDKHFGIDFGISIGTDLYSVIDGEVIASNNTCAVNDGYIGNMCGSKGFEGGGNFVHIKAEKDGAVYYINYSHMANVEVKKGDYVYKGMKIGTSGNSGNSTGAHLHFEIHKDVDEVGSDDGVINPCEFVDGLCD